MTSPQSAKNPTGPAGPSGVERQTIAGLTWIDVQEPNAATLHQLQRELGMHPLNLEDILSPAQRPKMDSHESYVFLVFRLPRREHHKRHSSELDVLLFKDKLVTFHDADLREVRSYFSDLKLFTRERTKLGAHGPDFLLYELLSRLFSQTYQLTDSISRDLDTLEARIFNRTSARSDTINKISNLRRRIIDYRKIAKPQGSFLQHVVTSGAPFIKAGAQHYWHTLIDTVENQRELFDTYMETVNALSDTNDSLVSHRLNETFRLLTIISVLFLPATFMLDLLGKDIPGAPLATLPFAFWFVLGALLTAEITFLLYLRRRRVL
jgi:magnesium transporter